MKKILTNFITRLAGGLLGFLIAWLVQQGVTIPLLTPEEVTALAAAIGVAGSAALLGLFNK